MKSPPYLGAIAFLVTVTGALSLLQAPRPARALPTFAQANQVNCSVC